MEICPLSGFVRLSVDEFLRLREGTKHRSVEGYTTNVHDCAYRHVFDLLSGPHCYNWKLNYQQQGMNMSFYMYMYSTLIPSVV